MYTHSCMNKSIKIVMLIKNNLLYLALLELIARNGFTPQQEGPPDFSGDQGPRQRQTNSNGPRPEAKPSDSSKPYTADQMEAVRR